MVKLKIKNLSKSFGTVVAINDFSFNLLDGELLAVLGPSGCGKSTLLSCIAGIETPEQGEIYLNDKCIFSFDKKIQTPPETRKIGFVFQNYALWPHMSVNENIEYPLKMAKAPKDKREEKLNYILNLVGLNSKAQRYPNQLSGGEQQRVALARALVMDPDLLLLDEPLSNLDAKLRETMQMEIRKIQQKLNLSVIHVTHDQGEAMAMADRIAVMNNGTIVQTGNPREIYETPKTQFVANFVGANTILKGQMNKKDNSIIVDDNHKLVFKSNTLLNSKLRSEPIFIALRPENIKLFKGENTDNNNLPTGTISNKMYKGDHIMYEVKAGDVILRAQAHPEEQFKTGEKVFIKCTHITVLDK